MPDSQLRALCDYLTFTYGTDPMHHVIAANEGNTVAIAAGDHLSTEKIPVVYMQNSGEGNVINPVASLINDKVTSFWACLSSVGEASPVFTMNLSISYQGEVTLKLLEDMDIAYYVTDKETTDEEVADAMAKFRERFTVGKQAAFVNPQRRT